MAGMSDRDKAGYLDYVEGAVQRMVLDRRAGRPPPRPVPEEYRERTKSEDADWCREQMRQRVVEVMTAEFGDADGWA